MIEKISWSIWLKQVQFNLALKGVLKHQFTQVPDATRIFSKNDGLLTLYQKKVENKHSEQINDEDEMIIDSVDLIQITDGLVDWTTIHRQFDKRTFCSKQYGAILFSHWILGYFAVK